MMTNDTGRAAAYRARFLAARKSAKGRKTGRSTTRTDLRKIYGALAAYEAGQPMTSNRLRIAEWARTAMPATTSSASNIAAELSGKHVSGDTERDVEALLDNAPRIPSHIA